MLLLKRGQEHVTWLVTLMTSRGRILRGFSGAHYLGGAASLLWCGLGAGTARLWSLGQAGIRAPHSVTGASSSALGSTACQNVMWVLLPEPRCPTGSRIR